MRVLLAAITCRKDNMGINLHAHLNVLDQAAADGCDMVGPDSQVTARLPDWRPGTLLCDIPC